MKTSSRFSKVIPAPQKNSLNSSTVYKDAKIVASLCHLRAINKNNKHLQRGLLAPDNIKNEQLNFSHHHQLHQCM